MRTKEFDQQLHDVYDRCSTDVIKKYVLKKHDGAVVKKYPHGDYGVDLFVKINSHSHYIEVEVKTSWKEGLFPYKSIHIPARKHKHLFLDHPVWFVVMRQDFRAFVYISGTDLVDKVTKNTKYSKDEEFFDIDMDLCDCVYLGTPYEDPKTVKGKVKGE